MSVVLLIMVLLAAEPDVRFFFSRDGVAEQEPISGSPAEFIDAYTGITPVIQAAETTARLYLWGRPKQFLRYQFISLDVNIHLLTGDVALAGSRLYDYIIDPSWDFRWGWIDQGTLTALKLDDIQAGALGYAWGLNWAAYGAGDLQSDAGTYAMLLGYVDLSMSADARAEIFLGVGEKGIAGSKPVFDLYFGWGDNPIDPYIPGGESMLPDAIIVPEPAAALLLVAAAAAVARRR